MLEALMIALFIVAGSGISGMIYPSSIGLKNKSRKQILGLSLVCLLPVFLGFVSLIGSKSTGAPNFLQSLLIVITGLYACCWPFVSLVMLVKKHFVLKKQAPPALKPDLPSEGFLQKAPAPEPEKKIRPAPVKPIKEPTRAIRTGWKLGLVEFTYEDSKGAITSRKVTVHSVTHTYLKGKCHARKAERTFRLDRIIGDIVDLETGEILRPWEFAHEHA
ncbi:WYL domain-containing protein (plasmid) [Pseudomonas luteola]